ncbi:Bardet-Biedl syndrome 5 protein [Schistosoma bovis]|uniref:Bardet-Biedl syndrome 5 protein n=1 Tax=Schistosoma bovis TaxID=6184 RepID=A0A430QHV2_SCHBO|nr:Bardet-Biedl syndrome 5 protein [Schistosoma bovis]
MLSYSNEVLWQDREVRFDAPRCDFVFRNGEVNFKLLENVEDVKGNNGDKESLFDEIDGVWNLSSDQAGSYLLGFRIDPRERLNKVAKQLGSLHSIYWKNPVLGITTGQTKDETIQNVKKINEDIDESRGRTAEDHCDILSVYLADRTKLKDREPVYNEDLGLAVERLPENYTISDLWKIIPERKKDK